MGPWWIVTLYVAALVALVAGVWRFVHHPGTRAARALPPLDATPEGWGSMTLDPDPEAPSRALEVAHGPWEHDGLVFGDDSAGWNSGPGGPPRGWTWDDPWEPEPERPPGVPLNKDGYEAGPGDFLVNMLDLLGPPDETRKADTGDVMDAHLAADCAEFMRHQDREAALWSLELADGCAAYVRELAVSL